MREPIAGGGSAASRMESNHSAVVRTGFGLTGSSMYELSSVDSRSSRFGIVGVGTPEEGTSSIQTLALLSL
jgi:hypothetical protein